MSAADDPKRNDSNESRRIRLSDGSEVTVSYRKAVGLVSLGRAEFLEDEKPKKAAKKTSVSTPARKGQEGAKAGNKPPSGGSPNERG